MISFFDEYRKLELPKGRHALFGSALMSIHNLRRIKDLDIIVKEDVWHELELRYRDHIHQDPLQIKIGNIKIFKDWPNMTGKIDEMIDNAEMVHGMPFVRFEYVIEWKRFMKRSKDMKDIAMIMDICRIRRSRI